ncbi:SgcJ/EcaC family oxidoreductase [Streptomyces sp. NPDC005485]|uniref:SgcJ/EcaC family oxidoreductase n=1 Tax=Streptomyces sp. NPDC005485 TaxID=3155591 RepID=UPI0033A6EDA8
MTMNDISTSTGTTAGTGSGATLEERGAEAAVLAVIDGVFAAWADNDADAAVASYAPDATALLPGTYLEGREAVRTAMAAAFAGPLKGAHVIHDVLSVRFSGTGTALVVNRAGLVLAGETEPRGENRALDSWVLSEKDGAWQIRAFHNVPENAG